MAIVVACSNSWFFEWVSLEHLSDFDPVIVRSPSKLSSEFLAALEPTWVFFPHWNTIIPEEVHKNYRCVVFHTAPLPYGRGGSPVQNLIIEGWKSSPVCALAVEKDLDAGPIYTQRQVSLSGSAVDIFKRIYTASVEMMEEICTREPRPTPQAGEVTVFKRRKQEQSRLRAEMETQKIYDHIRMLDGLSYPKAFLQLGPHKLEFSNARWIDGELTATVSFKLGPG